MKISYDEIQRLRKIEKDARVIRLALAHHLSAVTDPCQDRGVEWPCDVASALTEVETGI